MKPRHLAQDKDLRQWGIYRLVSCCDICLGHSGGCVQEDRDANLVKSEMQKLENGKLRTTKVFII